MAQNVVYSGGSSHLAESNSLTEKIELARTLPGTILETAEIPIEGLSVKDGIPLINGLPVSNLSEGEKLDLCIDVAIQNPSGLQIILIDGTTHCAKGIMAVSQNIGYRKSLQP